MLTTCSKCGGSGHAEVTGVYESTFRLVRLHPDCNGAQLAHAAECKETAMNNRLVWLERHGFVNGMWNGRERIWRISEGAGG